MSKCSSIYLALRVGLGDHFLHFIQQFREYQFQIIKLQEKIKRKSFCLIIQLKWRRYGIRNTKKLITKSAFWQTTKSFWNNIAHETEQKFPFECHNSVSVLLCYTLLPFWIVNSLFFSPSIIRFDAAIPINVIQINVKQPKVVYNCISLAAKWSLFCRNKICDIYITIVWGAQNQLFNEWEPIEMVYLSECLWIAKRI